MAWINLVIAGIFEVIWAMGLKASDGFTRPAPTALTVVGMIISFYFLAQATKILPIGTAYAIWTGIGAVGAVIFGMILYNEPRDLIRLVFVGLILAGIIGLRVTAPPV